MSANSQPGQFGAIKDWLKTIQPNWLQKMGAQSNPLPESSGYAVNSGMQPLLLTTLGRTGSTFALGLLGCHPEIVVYKPFRVEARYISYWVQFYQQLKDHKSWTSPISSDNVADPTWLLGNAYRNEMDNALYPEMRQWFDTNYVKSLQSFCAESLANHYLEVARIQQKPKPLFFAEKFLPNPFTEKVLEFLPGAREIFLVRDFRDMFCSITAFNKKRGFEGFARDMFERDDDYVNKSLKPSADMLLAAWEQRKKDALLIRYEELVFDTESVLTAIFGELGLDNSSPTIKKVLETASKANITKERHRTSVGPEQSIGRYRNDLDDHMKSVCRDAFKNSLESFGYQVDD
ncbi:MAG: sulfotransferase [Pseudomonadota bacterium]|nr:sulfotransferase [Pseudomonadota bacterium]